MKLQSSTPKGMVTFAYERTFKVSKEKTDNIWKTLNLRETFVDGQIFPFKVEFDAPTQNGAFKPGELNIHHGPGLSVHGAIGEVRTDYRSLLYFYGSYVLSFRLIRPTKLEFFREDDTIRLKLHCFLKPWFVPIWRLGNDVFWKFFGVNFVLRS